MAVVIVNNRIDGLRVTIYDVLYYLEAGRSHAEIADILLTVGFVAFPSRDRQEAADMMPCSLSRRLPDGRGSEKVRSLVKCDISNRAKYILPVTLEQIEAAVRYTDENRDEVMVTHRQIEDRLKRGNPPEIDARARAGRARMEALRA